MKTVSWRSTVAKDKSLVLSADPEPSSTTRRAASWAALEMISSAWLPEWRALFLCVHRFPLFRDLIERAANRRRRVEHPRGKPFGAAREPVVNC